MMRIDVIHQLIADLAIRAEVAGSTIKWASPVAWFGGLQKARIATVGLNPSNREFQDDSGSELSDSDRRFHTLNSLGLESWKEIKNADVIKIVDACDRYFMHNPYDRWFSQLEDILKGCDYSYYGKEGRFACHLDIVPFATNDKWGLLKGFERRGLIDKFSFHFGELLKQSNITTIILNGRSVLEPIVQLSDVKMSEIQMPKWSLRRGAANSVLGYAYQGRMTKFSGVDLEKEVCVKGYNHNLQSSFGVTNEVRKSIRDWLTLPAC